MSLKQRNTKNTPSDIEKMPPKTEGKKTTTTTTITTTKTPERGKKTHERK